MPDPRSYGGTWSEIRAYAATRLLDAALRCHFRCTLDLASDLAALIPLDKETVDRAFAAANRVRFDQYMAANTGAAGMPGTGLGDAQLRRQVEAALMAGRREA